MFQAADQLGKSKVNHWYCFHSKEKHIHKHVCDILQQNRKQVAEAYFRKWVIDGGIGMKNDSSVDFEICIVCFFEKVKGILS